MYQAFSRRFFPFSVLFIFFFLSLAQAAPFTVTTTDDDHLTVPAGSLREAIQNANTSAEADTIDFNLSGTIDLSAPLPPITGPLTITGHTSGTTINGSMIAAATDGLVIYSSAVIVDRLTLQNFTGSGILIDGATSDGNTISNCILQNNANGLTIAHDSSDNTIVQNTILNNNGIGILIRDPGSDDNLIQANRIHNNSGTGVVISESVRNTLTQNLIYNNSGNILLTGGGNNSLDPPVLMSVVDETDPVTGDPTGNKIVSGMWKGPAGNQKVIEFFYNETADSIFKESEDYLDSVTVDPNVPFIFIYDSTIIPLEAYYITATATDILTGILTGDTSEFSQMNQAPANNVPGTQTVREDDTFLFSGADLISIEDADNNGTDEVEVTLKVTSGALTLNGTAPFDLLSFSAGDGTSDDSMTFTGTIADINAALDGLIYTPPTNQAIISDTLTITTNDQAAPELGGPLSAEDTVAIQIARIIVTPVTLTTSEDANATNHTATFDVVLSVAPTANVVLNLSVGDASEGSIDNNSLTFDASNWDSPQRVTVTGEDDDIADGPQEYTITISPDETTVDPNYNGLNPPDVTVRNTDDDTAGITVTPIIVPPATGLITTEAGGTAEFTIVLNTKPTGSVRIDLNSDDTTEGTVTPTSFVTFDDSNWNIEQTVTVRGVDDFIDDGDISYNIITTINTTETTASEYLNVNVDKPVVAVTNTDNDTAEFVFSDITALTTTEAGGTATFTISLGSQPEDAVTISLSSSNPDEGIVSHPSWTFDNTNWNDPQIFTVTGQDDDVDDGDIPYQIIIDLDATDDANYALLNPPDVDVLNIDDDTAGITVEPPALSTNESGTEATFTVVLDSEPTEDVTITLNNPDSTEVTIDKTSLIFTAENWNQEQTVTVTGVDDNVVDGDQTVTIAVTASSTDALYSAVDPADVAVSNTDDDTAGVIVTPTSDLITDEGGGEATFTVVLNSEPTANVTINLTSTNTDEGTVSPDSLLFIPGEWNIEQTVTVTGVDDDVQDGDIQYSVTTEAVSADPLYDGFDVADVNLKNTDNDTAGIDISTTTLDVTEGATAIYTIALYTIPTDNVTITLAPTGSQISVDPPEIIFPANDPAALESRTITVTGIDDELAEGPHTDAISHTVNSNDLNYSGQTPGNVTVNIADNDVSYAIIASQATVHEGNIGSETPISFTVTRDGAIAEPSSVDYTLSGTATEGSDYNNVVPDGTISFPAGETRITLTMDVLGDEIAEGDETIIVTLGNPTAPGTGTGTLATDTATTTIIDDDSPGITISTTKLSLDEGGTSATYTIWLNTNPTSDVTVTISPNAQISLVSPADGNLLFSPTNAQDPQTVEVIAVDDEEVEGLHTGIISHAAASNDLDYDGLSAQEVTATITDNDIPPLTINEFVASHVGAPDSYEYVEIKGEANTDYSEYLLLQIEGDSTENPGMVDSLDMIGTTSADGYWWTGYVTDQFENGTMTLMLVKVLSGTIAVGDDLDSDNDGVIDAEYDLLILDAVAVSDGFAADLTYGDGTPVLQNMGGASRIPDGNGAWMINDFDGAGIPDLPGSPSVDEALNTPNAINSLSEPGVTLTETDGITEVVEGGATDTYMVRLDTIPTGDVTIILYPRSFEISLASGDVVKEPGFSLTLTFAPENWHVDQVVTVTAVDDAKVEGAHTAKIQHSVSGANYSGLVIPDLTVYITDNDSAGITLTESDGATAVIEGGAGDTYTLQLNTIPFFPVTVTVTADNQVTVSPKTLTFAADDSALTPQIVTVTAVNDTAVENAHTGIIAHSAASTDPAYNGIQIPDVIADITDNDIPGQPGVVLSATQVSVAEGGTSAAYTISLNTVPTETVTVHITTDSQVTVNPTQLTFSPNNTATTGQMVTVTAEDDTAVEGNHQGSITHAATSLDGDYDKIPIGSVTAMITDNDTAGTPGVTLSPNEISVAEGGDEAIYTIQLNTVPADTVTITISPDSEVTVNPTQLIFNADDTALDKQTVTVSAVDDSDVEGQHTGTITHAAASNDSAYQDIAIGNVTASIADNDAVVRRPTISVSDTSGLEGSGTLSFRVLLSDPSGQDISVDYQTADGSAIAGLDYTAATGSLTIPAGETTSTIQVSLIDDALDESNETFTLTLSNPIGADLGNASATGTIIDDDEPYIPPPPPPPPAQNQAPVITGQQPLTVQAGAALEITLNHLSVTDYDDPYPSGFTLSVMDGADYTRSGNTITPEADYTGTLSIPVRVFDGQDYSNTFNLQITVPPKAAENQAPVITGQQPLIIEQGNLLRLALSHLTVTDPDNVYPDDFTLTVMDGENYQRAGHTILPVSGFDGTLTVPVRVNDGVNTSEVFGVTVTVTAGAGQPENLVPVITGQQPIRIDAGQSYTPTLTDLMVADPDDVYPGSFTLTVMDGENYTLEGGTVTPIPGFNGILNVPVTVNDGTDTSAPFGFQILVGDVEDSDGDGLPDAWERQYGLDPFVDDADGDKDGDGFTNFEEYLCGTDPTDPASRPAELWADAGPDQTVAPGQGVKLSALNSFDADGIVDEVLWLQIGGPAVVLSDANSPETAFTAPANVPPGGVALRFEMTLIDSGCGIAKSDEVLVNVTADNQPPVIPSLETVHLAEDVETVLLDGAEAVDPDGEELTYQWTQITGPPVTLSDPNAPKPSFQLPPMGAGGDVYRFRLMVTDASGLQADADYWITVGGTPPSAAADVDVDVLMEGNNVILDASGSQTPEGQLRYIWRQTYGPPVLFSSVRGEKTTFVLPAVPSGGERIELELIVQDGKNLLDTWRFSLQIEDNGITGMPEGATTTRTAGGEPIGIEVKGNGGLVSLSSVKNPIGGPNIMPYGRIDAQVRVSPPGETVQVLLYMHQPLSPAYRWYAFTPDRGWYDITGDVLFSDDRTYVTLTLTDGGDGDGDGAVNGIIQFSSGPGIIVQGDDGEEPPVDTDGGGGGGGCFLRTLYGDFN